MQFFSESEHLGFVPKEASTIRLPGPERIYVGGDGIVKATGTITSPARLQKYSGTYTFQDAVLILDVKSAEYENMPAIKSGDKLKMKISFLDHGNSLWFDKRSYKRK